MKKKFYYLNLIFIIIIFVLLCGCSIYIPSDFGFYPNYYKIILDITPDHSSVYLNGKFIGLAYEFSSFKAPLSLRSLKNELIFKKKGYLEKAIILSDIFDPTSNKIIITEKLLKDKLYPKDKSLEDQPVTKSLEYQGKRVKVKENIKIKSQNDKIKLEIITGSLILSHQESSIFLDDKFIGISPESKIIKNLHLTKEKHTIKVFKPGYKVFTKAFDLTRKETFKIKIILEKE